MSAEPVAEVSYSSWNGMNISVLAGVKTLPAGTPLYAQSPAQARAMAIAECARVVGGYANEYAGERAAIPLRDATNEIRALSSPPSVTEEWVENIISEGGYRDSGVARPVIRATLAALGVKVEGAAK